MIDNLKKILETPEVDVWSTHTHMHALTLGTEHPDEKQLRGERVHSG